MKAVSQFVVNVCDLFEAEGRTLRTVVRDEASRLRIATTTLAMRLSLLAIAIPIIVGGVGLLAVTMMWLLEPALGDTAALGATGFTVLALGVGLLIACGVFSRGSTA